MITPLSQTIEQILKNSVILHIPSYQRPFDWGKEELSEMIADIKSSLTSEEQLFLGNFIFEEVENQNSTKSIKIVDGQQRVTTISLILIAIRQRARALKDDIFAKEIHDLIAISSAMRRTDSPKFIPSESIKDLFLHMCNFDWDSTFPSNLNGLDIRSQVLKIKPLYQNICLELNCLSIEDLKDFSLSFLNSYVITLNVSSDEDVFSIFERTNARGLDLNAADLLKNYLFSFEDATINSYWDVIIENSGSTLLKMMKYFWVSSNGYIQQSQLYRSIKYHLNTIKSLGVTPVISFVDEVKIFSEYYRIINRVSDQEKQLKDWFDSNNLKFLGSNQSYLQEIVRSLTALKLFRVTQPTPLIYSIFQSAKNCGLTNPSKITRLIRIIENYSFVNNVISGKTANEVERYYARFSVEYSNTTDFDSTTNDFVKGLKAKLASETEFKSSLIEELTYENSKKKYELLIYFFDRYNNYDFTKNQYFKGSTYYRLYEPEISFTKRNNNIEHFYPQTPLNPLTDDQKVIINQLGNLLVVSKHTNSILGNKSVADKINTLKSKPSLYRNINYIESLFDLYDTNGKWDFDTIQERSENLAKIAYDHLWSIK